MEERGQCIFRIIQPWKHLWRHVHIQWHIHIPGLGSCGGILRQGGLGGCGRINPTALRNPENVHQKRSEHSEAAGSVPVSESLSPSIRGTAIFVPPASNKGFTLSLQSAFMQRSVEASNYEAERRGGWGAVLRPTAAHLIIRSRGR